MGKPTSRSTTWTNSPQFATPLFPLDRFFDGAGFTSYGYCTCYHHSLHATGRADPEHTASTNVIHSSIAPQAYSSGFARAYCPYGTTSSSRTGSVGYAPAQSGCTSESSDCPTYSPRT